MRRKIQLLLLLLLVAASTETGVRASTDCERWIATYKAELAHAKAVKRLQAAHARVKHAAQRRLANYVKRPAAPKPVLAHYAKPRLTPEQMLERFELLCGDLPEDGKPSGALDKLLDGKMPPFELASDEPSFLPLIPGDTDEGLIPEQACLRMFRRECQRVPRGRLVEVGSLRLSVVVEGMAAAMVVRWSAPVVERAVRVPLLLC